MVRDRVVIGIWDKQVQKRLLETADLNLAKATDIARAAELTKIQLGIMQRQCNSDNGTMKIVDAVNDKQYNKYTSGGHQHAVKQTNADKYHQNLSVNKNNNNDKNVKKFNTNFSCKNCKRIHEYRKCPAYGKRCNNCGQINHFAIACGTRKVRELINANEDNPEFHIDGLSSKNIYILNNKNESWHQKIRVENVVINFKLDTGAELNVLPLNFIKKMKNVNIRRYNNVVQAYGGNRLDVVGSADIVCCVNNEISMQSFVIIDTNCVPILGLRACIDLKLLRRINNIESMSIKAIENKKTSLIEKNSDLFHGLGCFVSDFNIELKEGAQGSVKSARRIPLSLMDRVKNKLLELEQNEIIKEVLEPSDFVSNLVIVEKKKQRLTSMFRSTRSQ